ncbi:restriction endonuclease subunit M, partial [Candidatus Poribacteria bacterium]|nr:restriction endonuclease subunit M [Candidatus Poribacteria bacterium]
EAQKEIVAEIEGYQKVIDGARAVVENYRPHIPIDLDWPFVPVGDIFRKSDETVLPESLEGPITYIGLENITQNTGEITGEVTSDDPSQIKSLKNVFGPGDILYGKLRPNLNKVWLADRNGICSTDIFVIRAKTDRVVPAVYAYVFRSSSFNDAVLGQLKGAQLPRVGWSSFAGLEVPLPPLDTQEAIVAEIEAEQVLVASNRELIARMEKKIEAAIGRVWNEGD